MKQHPNHTENSAQQNQIPRVKVAIVVLNWNGRDYLAEFLPSVINSLKQYSEAVLYVADNGSTDDSVAYLQTHFPSVKIVQNEENYGFAGGYNQALKQIESEYYVLLNSDVAVTPNWIAPIIQLMDEQPYVGACQPKIKAYKQPNYFEYAGAAGGYMDKFGYMFCRGRFFDICEEDTGQYELTDEVFWASGAALFIRSELYHRLGGLDADFFAHMEEIDLCWRIRRAGFGVFYCSQSEVFHLGGGTLPQGNPRKTYLNFRNNLALLCKNLPSRQLYVTLPFRVLLDVIAATKSLLSGDVKDAKAIFKANIDFLRKLPFWLNKRRQTQVISLIQEAEKVNNQPNVTAWYQGSIVKDYFLSGKRYFKEVWGDK